MANKERKNRYELEAIIKRFGAVRIECIVIHCNPFLWGVDCVNVVCLRCIVTLGR